MTAFALSVLGSIVAAIVIVVATATFSKTARWIMTATVSRWLGIDVEYVFSGKDDVENDLKKELERASEVSILSSRGNELQRTPFIPLFAPRTRRINVRILLPDTALPPGQYDWTMQREKELTAFDPAFGGGLLSVQVQANCTFILQHVKAGTVQLRLFNAPHIGRIIVTERYAYYTPYRADAHGRDSRIYKFRRGDMYDNLKRLFEQLWNLNDQPQDAA